MHILQCRHYLKAKTVKDDVARKAVRAYVASLANKQVYFVVRGIVLARSKFKVAQDLKRFD